MKKITALLLMCLSMIAHAGQNVSIIWPFSIGSNQANFVRVIIAEANQQQTKYNFILDNKPGAGGYIAANHVQNSNNLALLTSSSSFFSRPIFYPNESHKVEDFKPVYIECHGQPYGVVSSKYKTIADLRKEKRLTVGANFGSITEAMVRELQKLLPNTQLDIVPYPGTLQATQEVLAGRLDLNIDFASETMQWVEEGKLFVIGTSGNIDHKNFKTFANQGHNGFVGLVGSYAIFTKADTSPAIIEELHQIFTKAATSAGPRLQNLYARDFCPAMNLNLKQTNEMYDRWSKYWPAKLNELK